MKELKINRRVKVIAILCLVLFLTACNLNERSSYSFSLENGDVINIVFKSKNGYTINQKNGSFVISKDNKTISQGIFLTDKLYEEYKNIINENKNKEILNKKTGKKDNNDYIYYEVQGKNGTEYNYIVKVFSADSAVMIGCLTNKKEAQEVFEQLIIKYDLNNL
ncbi:MAG: hypothetical protein HFF36_05460 [Coprobacillus sp.]|nr:hypothetical protein [Coprobacillus sp.]